MSLGPLESHPDQAQKQRLVGWLSALRAACLEYSIVLDTDDDEPLIVDLLSGTIIGVGITYLTDIFGSITALDCSGSILDGVWLIDTPDGPREQRDAPIKD